METTNTGELLTQWFDSSVKPDEVSVQDFDKYIDEYLAERVIADEIEAKLTEQNKKIMAMSGKLMEFLDLMGKNKHVTSLGTISKVETTSWKAPEGEGREELYQYLKDKGEYDNITAFNAKKFSSWYSSEIDADPSFKFNGVEKNVTKYIRFSKAKGN